MSDPNLSNLRGLPLNDLIGAPFMAVNRAQYNLATTMIVFINSIGFDDGKTRTLDFELQRPVDNGSQNIMSQTVTVNAPLLGLVPIPALLIDHVQVKFSLELQSKTASSEKTDASAELKLTYGKGFVGAEFTGKVATQRENTRSTDNTAKYDILVEAHQQPYTEGMSKLMDLFASATDPISIKPGS